MTQHSCQQSLSCSPPRCVGWRVVAFPALLLGSLPVFFGCGQDSSGEYQKYSRTAGSIEAISASETLATNGTTDKNRAATDSQASVTPDAADSLNGHDTAIASIPDAADPIASSSTVPNPSANGTEALSVTQSEESDPVEAPKPKLPVRVVQLLVKERRFLVEGPQGAVRMSYDDIDLLRVLNMEPVTSNALELLPQWLKDLDGKRVRLRGFMYPSYQETELTGFGFARDNDICCFVRQPKIYDVFQVQLRGGETTDYIEGRPFDVVGVFHFRPDAEEWPIYGMYHIDDAVVLAK